MQNLFKGYYQPTPEQFKEMWEEGTFVFDTNVLLNLYRYKEESKDEVLNVIKKLDNRIWIPYQVGLEFHRNRLSVLGEQNSNLSTIKNSIKDSINSIEKKCRDLDLDKRHSDIETLTFIERFQDLSNSVINELDEITPKKLTNDIEDDSILTEISKLFNSVDGTLGSSPENQEVLNKIYKDGEFRAKNKIPPSFEDISEAKKNKSGEEYYAFEGLDYKKGYGDLIVWKQIIEYAKKNDKKSIVFITDDKKEDWMRIINSHGKKTISARPELVSEIFKKAGVENFYIYDTDGFLKYSKKYLKAKVSDEALEDIKTINYFNAQEPLSLPTSLWASSYNRGLREIEEWLESRYSKVIMPKDFKIACYGIEEKGLIVPIFIVFCVQSRLRDLSSQLERVTELYNNGNANKFHIILVESEFTLDVLPKKLGTYRLKEFIEKQTANYSNLIDDRNIQVHITVGSLKEDTNDFVPVLDYLLA